MTKREEEELRATLNRLAKQVVKRGKDDVIYDRSVTQQNVDRLIEENTDLKNIITITGTFASRYLEMIQKYKRTVTSMRPIVEAAVNVSQRGREIDFETLKREIDNWKRSPNA